MTTDPTIFYPIVTYILPDLNDSTVQIIYEPQTYNLDALYNQPVPSFQNQTIFEILKNPAYHDVTIKSIVVDLSAQHKYDCSMGSLVRLDIYDINGGLVPNGTVEYSDKPEGGHSGTSRVKIHTVLSDPPLLSIASIYFSVVYPEYCVYYNYTKCTLKFTINMQVGICNKQSLNNPQCAAFCDSNKQQCINDYLDYCLPRNSTNLPIMTNQSCQKFFSDYIQNNGSLNEIDGALSYYCQKKYSGFGDLFNKGNQVDQELCACHMPSDQYDNFKQQLIKFNPKLDNPNAPSSCFLPNCALSGYKSISTTNKCNLPKCVNIGKFNNDGTFDDSSVTINPIDGCADILSLSNKSANPLVYWISGSIVLIFIIVIIVVFVLFKK